MEGGFGVSDGAGIDNGPLNGVRLLEQGLGIGVARQLPGPVVRRLWDGNYSCGAGIGDGLLNGMRLLE